MERKTIIAAGGLVKNDEGAYLMIFRRGKWDLPKGKLDEGESIPACAVREVQEETGLNDIILGNLISITHHEYFDKWVDADVLKETHWYNMTATDHQQLVPQTEEDITEIKWVPVAELDAYLQDTYDTIVEVFEKAGVK